MILPNLLSTVVAGVSTEDTADLRVSLGGKPLAGDAAARLLHVSVSRTVGEAAQLTLRIAAWDSDTEELTWVDDTQFAPGATVEVELGFLGRRETVFFGDIASLELDATPAARAVLTITAYDLLHRLGRGQRSHVYEKMTCAAIVSDIARKEYHLEVDAPEDPRADPQREAVHQNGESDLSLILRLAAEIGYEVFARRTTLVFRRSQAGQPAQVALDASRDLIGFSARLSASGQLGGVDVVTLRSDTKQGETVSENNPDSADARYGSGGTRVLVIDDPLATHEQARARARAELERMRSGYLDASATALGRVDIAAGMVVDVRQLGTRFGGAYYVNTVTHTLSDAGGLRTTLELKGQPR
jgi:uncharacterized protein